MEHKGQLSLFDMDVSSFVFQKKMPVEKVEKKESVNLQEYLQKGEKIIELLRSRKEVGERTFQKSNFLEMFNFNTYNQRDGYGKVDYIIKQVRNRLIRPTMDEIMEQGIDVLNPLFRGAFAKLPVTPVAEGTYESKLMNSFFCMSNKKCTGVLKLCLPGQEDAIYLPFGKKATLTKKQHLRRWHLRANKREDRICADPGLLLAKPVLCIYLRERTLEKMQTVTKEECECFQYIMECMHERIEIYASKETKITILESAYEIGFIRDYLEEEFSNFAIDVIPDKKYEGMTRQEKIDGPVLRENDFLLLYFITQEVPERFVKNFFDSSYLFSNGILVTELVSIFEYVFEEYVEDRAYDEYQNQMRAEYAKSFMTKKTISQKVLEAMASSDLNSYFGYVEFDTDVELEKMVEIAKEWRALSEFMGFKKHDEVSLRFRRLGNHKALGLYYSAFKCICVDVHAPFSMCHEYMHMLDYENDRLSRKYAFSRIKQLYKAHLYEQMNKNEALEKMLLGKTKYNISYYLQATEIFARCGELYVTRCLGVNNSLAKPEYGFAYPTNDEFLEEVEIYFDAFFGIKAKDIKLKEVI